MFSWGSDAANNNDNNNNNNNDDNQFLSKAPGSRQQQHRIEIRIRKYGRSRRQSAQDIVFPWGSDAQGRAQQATKCPRHCVFLGFRRAFGGQRLACASLKHCQDSSLRVTSKGSRQQQHRIEIRIRKHGRIRRQDLKHCVFLGFRP